MALEAGYQFNQGSLQDYVDCPRRFHLRHVRQLRWPAVQSKPVLENERHLQLGTALHRLIHQHVTGVSPTVLSRTITDPRLRRWWDNYLKADILPPQHGCYPEIVLSTSLGDWRLVARYDLVAVNPRGDEALIVDWKTNRKRPRRTKLRDRLQTRVYPYVLAEGREEITERGALEPEGLRMIYWFANFASRPEEFAYDTQRHQDNEVYLLRLVGEIADQLATSQGGELLPRTDERVHCATCRYRSLCRRGVEPGLLSDEEDDLMREGSFDLKLDFEQITEMEMT